MVAHNYFDRAKPHYDDHDLIDAIRRGIVPGEIDDDGRWVSGCLRGGPFVLELHRAGTDPCESCEGPRSVNGSPEGRIRCGGRPPKEARETTQDRVRWSQGADARKVQRAGVIAGILRLVKSD